MAFQAKRSNIFQITLATALDYRNDMIGIPKALPDTLSWTDPPAGHCFEARGATQSLQVSPGREAIDTTLRADALVALEHLFADVARIGPEPPFLHAPVRTKRQPTPRHFQVAPAAKVPAVHAFGKAVTIGPPARHGSRGAH